MNHKIILLIIFSAVFLFTACYLIKNKPQYLVLLGIRGFVSVLFIHFVNYFCGIAHLAAVIQVNPISLISGAFLGIPGILLLYVSKIYLL